MFSKIICLISLFFLCFLSCRQPEAEVINEDGSFEVFVEHVAGDDYVYELGDQELSYMNYPFHMGYVRGYRSDTVKCIIISKAVSSRSRIKAKPIGLLSTIEQGTRNSYIIAVPNDIKNRSLDMENFSDLISKYSSVKNIIEFWLLNRCGFGCIKSEGWGNESAAEFVLEKLKEI